MIHRIRRPVIFLAYGENGLEWLGKTASRLPQVTPVLRDMMQAHVIQFWALGVDVVTDAAGPLLIFDGVVEAFAVKERLHLARADTHRAQFGLDLNGPMLIVERWSLFQDGWEMRGQLRDAFSRARFVDCEPKAGPELDYQWISLVDAVRSPKPADAEAIRRIREALKPETLHDVPLFIDRSTEGGGAVDSVTADRCFHQLAVSLLTSDLAFAPPDAGDDRRSRVLAHDVDNGHVHPLSIVSLIHSDSDLREAYVGAIRVHLVEGQRARELLQSASATETLDRLVVIEAEEMRSGSYAARDARRRREESAAELLRRAILQRDTDAGLDEVFRARQKVKSHFAPLNSTVASKGAGALALLQVEPGELWWIGGVLLVMVTGALVWWQRTRPRMQIAPPDPSPDLDLLEAQKQWLALLEAVERILREFQDLFTSRTGHDFGRDSPAWEPVPEHPYDWRLKRPVTQMSTSRLLEEKFYKQLVRTMLMRTRGGESPSDALTEGLEAEASSILRRHQAARSAVLGASLQEPHTDPLRAGLQQVRLMVNAGRDVPTAEVLWLIHPDLKVREELSALESRNHRSLVRFLVSDEIDRTVRLDLGASVPWSEVLSLSFLKTS
jgi:hypothetical protein